MAGVRRKPLLRSGKYRGWFTEHTGHRRHFTGTRNRRETLAIAQHLEDEHRQVRLGYRPAPSSPQRYQHSPLAEVITEYLQWGALQGGAGGRPWSTKHHETRRFFLTWWQTTLAVSTLGDLVGCLPRAEQALYTLAPQRSSKTLMHYLQALKAMFQWCVDRGYLEHNPLTRHRKMDTTPKRRRRALTGGELRRLLEVCPPHRRLLFEVACLSGLRAEELRQVATTDLDLRQGGLQLHAEWTKNRQESFQPLPRRLIHTLHAFVETGEAAALYAQAYRRRNTRRAIPRNPLLYVPALPARALYQDLAKARIPRETSDGYVDFHALRAAYITFVVEAGANVKDAQTLARHSDPRLTMGVYARSRQHRLQDIVETMDEALWPADRALSVHAQRVNAPDPRPLQGTPLARSQAPRLPTLSIVPGREMRDKQTGEADPHNMSHQDTPLLDDNSMIPGQGSEEMRALSVHDPDSILVALIARWPSLSPAVRWQIWQTIQEDTP